MRRVIAVLLALGCIGLGGLFYWMNGQDDVTPPVITFPDEILVYEEGEDTSVLLEGVKATDEVDGDVTGSLVVESVIPMEDEITATVLYYAKDSSHNVAKVTRTVEYRPKGGVIWLMETEAETETETAETETETEEDVGAGLGPECPRIVLTTNKVTIKEGESYNLLSYVKDITDDVDGDDWLYTQIHIGGMSDISGPGVYDLYYTVVDREGNMSNEAKLVLTIE